MSVKIHGRDYMTVAERINAIHEKHETLSIETELISWEDNIIIVKAKVTHPGGVFTGHAYEVEGSTQINRTSALENCETSAIGRALASAGFGGTEFASANEVENAIHHQKSSDWDTKRFEAKLRDIKSKFDDAGIVSFFNEHLEANYGASVIEMIAQKTDQADTIIKGLARIYKQETK